MRYTVDERLDRIVEIVRQNGRARVSDLAAELGLSKVTLRRDVETLAAQGRLRRVRGYVIWPKAAGEPQTVPAASSMSGPVVGMVVPMATSYFAEIVRGAQEAAEQAGGRLVLALSNYNAEQYAQQVRMLLEDGVDGLLLAPDWPTGTAGMADFTDPGVPAVLIERRGLPGTPAARLDRACSDHAAGAGLAVAHLASLGHKRIALVSGMSPTQPQVLAGYRGALEALGLTEPLAPLELYTGQVVPGRIETAAGELAAALLAQTITAALVVGDVDALMIVQALRERGVRVPEDLALVAYDDDVAALSGMPLTAVAPPKHAVGQAAVRLLLQRLSNDDGSMPRTHLDLVPELRLRASCGRLLKAS